MRFARLSAVFARVCFRVRECCAYASIRVLLLLRRLPSATLSPRDSQQPTLLRLDPRCPPHWHRLRPMAEGRFYFAGGFGPDGWLCSGLAWGGGGRDLPLCSRVGRASPGGTWREATLTTASCGRQSGMTRGQTGGSGCRISGRR